MSDGGWSQVERPGEESADCYATEFWMVVQHSKGSTPNSDFGFYFRQWFIFSPFLKMKGIMQCDESEQKGQIICMRAKFISLFPPSPCLHGFSCMLKECTLRAPRSVVPGQCPWKPLFPPVRTGLNWAGPGYLTIVQTTLYARNPMHSLLPRVYLIRLCCSGSPLVLSSGLGKEHEALGITQCRWNRSYTY